ncbi:hypothetical protein [Rahnella sp. EDr1-10]|uniref:hypothetical protein n=1 Tax=Rahnella sp. EDr1-10 TaxID=3368623 RepID=UPI003BACC0F9
MAYRRHPQDPQALSPRAAARWLYFSTPGDCRKIPLLRSPLPSGSNPRKKRAVFHHSSGVIFERGWEFLGRNLTLFDSLKIKSGQEFSGRHLIFSDWFFLRVRWRAQKSGRPGVRDAGLESRGEGTAQRQDFAPHSGVSDHVRRPSGSAGLKKARRVQRGKAISSLLGFGAKSQVSTAIEKPKCSRF